MSESATASIFHLAEAEAWAAAAFGGSARSGGSAGSGGSAVSRSARSAGYRAPSLDSEGFIHLSTRAQFVDTANRYYRGRTDLVLLEVDPAALPAGSLVYEASTNDLLFPHLYAALPVDAIIGVHTFQPADDGSFAAPASLAGSQRVPSETRQAGTYWPGWNGELTTIV